MYILSLGMLIAKLFRNIFFLIDSVIFNLIPKIYNLLIAIARTSPLSQADISDMASRVYKLLAVFMIFKVTFSLIMYVVNPDDFSDKSKGVSKLVPNIVISLALLVLTPYIFSYAYQLQTIVLESNTIASIIFGDKDGTNDTLNNGGNEMAFLALSPFVIPNLDYFDCATLYTYDRLEKKNVLNPTCFGFENVDDYTSKDKCSSVDNRALCSNVNSSDKYLQLTDIQNYAAAIQFKNYGLLLRNDLITKYYYTTGDKKDNAFAFDYQYIISTVIGVLMVLFLITTCMDIGLRSIKLAFLQLIAPIPILSYIDPKSGKDGMFKKWYDMAFKTYLSLFIRLFALYFAIYIIGKLNGLVDIIDGSYVTNGFIKIFIMIGALMFAKNFIKILESLGIKFDGAFEINPIKKFNEQALGGKRITGAAGGLVASTVDRGARLATAPGWKGKAAALAGTVPGLFGSAVRGASANGGYAAGKKAQSAVNRRLREGRINGLSSFGSYLDYLGSRYGIDDATLEAEGTRIQQYEDEALRIKERRDAETMEYRKTIANRQEAQKTAKYAQSVRGNVKSKADAMLGVASDVLNKKGNFGKNYEDLINKINAGNFAFNDKERDMLTKAGVANIPTSASTAAELNAVKAQMNAKKAEVNYKANNIANKTTLEALRKSLADGGGTSTTLTEDTILHTYDSNGNYVEKKLSKNQRFTADDIALLEDDVGKYEKEATLAIANDLNDSAGYVTSGVLESEGRAFNNRKSEFDAAVIEANSIQKSYNTEYGLSGADALDDIETYTSGSFGKYIKELKDDMDNDDNAEKINEKLYEYNKDIEEANRQITNIENKDEYMIDYEFVDPVTHKKYMKKISLRDYEEEMKPRKARHEREKKRKQEKRSIYVNRS